MSRLIVKNLPKNITEDKIRDLFSQKGTITDVQLKYTKDGKFRNFGFVGYQTTEQAEEAINYFHNSCIRYNKITVEHCAALGGEAKPKAWSKYAVDSSAYQKEHGIVKEVTKDVDSNYKKPKKEKTKQADIVQEVLEKHKEDPLFLEFMESHARKESKALWSNDSISQLLKKTLQAKDVACDNIEEEVKQEVHDIKKKRKVKQPVKDEDESVEEKDNDEEEKDNDEEEKEEEKQANKEISDKEYMKSLIAKKTPTTEDDVEPKPKTRQKMQKQIKEKIQLYTVKVRGLGYTTSKKDIKIFFTPLVPYTIRLPKNVKGLAYVAFKTEKEMKQALNKNRSFLSGKRLAVVEYKQQESNEIKDDGNDGIKNKWEAQTDALKCEEDISDSGRLFVRNLSYTTNEDELQKLFETYGPVTEVELPIDKFTRKLKGFGVITFLMPEHAVRAYSELDGSSFAGRMLHLLPAKSKPNTDELDENLTYQQKKELKLKQNAGLSHNWNTLFLGPNAVAEIVAKNFGKSKEHVLEANAAVRLALGETQIVGEMKKFLEESGVCLDAFNQAPTKRSKTIILAKNLPAHTEVSEITEIFSKHGIIGRVVMPSTGVTAIIEYLEPSEARTAFTKLAYSKFKSLPLFLEWAPDNTFLSSNTVPNAIHSKPKPVPKTTPDKVDTHASYNVTKPTSGSTKPTSKVAKSDAAVDYQFNPDDDEDPEENTTLFIRNLSFQTREGAIRELFQKCGKIHCINVATKKDPNDRSVRLSMGYGFIQFKYKSGTEKCLKTMQMVQLDGKTLELKRSDRTLSTQVNSSSKKGSAAGLEQTGSKILVRNIPFQANKYELEDLFKAFGEIKSLRLPKKMTPGEDQHRGFAFIDYQNKSAAKQAFDAMCQSTHLYGRRLVLEWAVSEENVDDIRKRTAQNFTSREQKYSKKALLDPISLGLKGEEM